MVANIHLSLLEETSSISELKLELNTRKNEHKQQAKWKVVINACNKKLLEVSEEVTHVLFTPSLEVYTYLPEEISH